MDSESLETCDRDSPGPTPPPASDRHWEHHDASGAWITGIILVKSSKHGAWINKHDGAWIIMFGVTGITWTIKRRLQSWCQIPSRRLKPWSQGPGLKQSNLKKPKNCLLTNFEKGKWPWHFSPLHDSESLTRLQYKPIGCFVILSPGTTLWLSKMLS